MNAPIILEASHAFLDYNKGVPSFIVCRRTLILSFPSRSVTSTDWVPAFITPTTDQRQGTVSPTTTHFSEFNPASSTAYSSSPSPVSTVEAMFYYSGLPSSPRLVYRTETTPWTKPTGPEAYRRLKELRPVFDHRLNSIWGDLGPQVCQLLDSQEVPWTSIDVVWFADVGKRDAGPVVLWIGVAPETLFGEAARISANGCLDLLKKFHITDVEVEYRESMYTRSAGPNLLKPVSNQHSTIHVRGPLTPALGLSIAAQATLHVEGTGGLYFAKGGDSKKIFLVTARHVLFPQNEANINYARKNVSAPRRNVVLLGTKAFSDITKSIRTRSKVHGANVEYYERQIKRLQSRETGEDKDKDKDKDEHEHEHEHEDEDEDEDKDEDEDEDKDDIEEKYKELQSSLDEANKAIKELDKFHEKVKEWSQPSERIIGHIARSPPITLNAGTEGFTEDYAVVELDSHKFKKVFKGNVIDLGAF